MTGRLRGLRDRPIAEHERRRVFVLVAAVLVGVALALSLTAPTRHAPVGAAVPQPDTGVEHGRLPQRLEPVLVAAGQRRVVVVARRFLGGYLAYLYGHRPVRAVRPVSARLRGRLVARPPRVSPATRRRHPQIERLTARPLDGRSRWLVTATIADGGVASYPLELTVADRHGQPLVVSVGED